MVLRTALGAMHRHLKNNTPVHTEVLWGGGLWWGLWAGAPQGRSTTSSIGASGVPVEGKVVQGLLEAMYRSAERGCVCAVAKAS